MIFETVFTEVIQRTPDVRSFRFDKPDGFSYEAGQFMYVTIETAKGRMMKHFTISSSPSEGYLEFTKMLTGSDFSKGLEAAEVQDWVMVNGSYGNFSLDPEQGKIVMLCGGIGITPFRSMIRYSFDYGLDNDIILMYSCGTFDEIVFREELDEMTQRKKGLRVFYTLTREGEWWDGEVGRLDGEKVRRLVPDHQERLCYICGPKAMVESMKAVLMSAGISGNRTRTEEFTGY